MYQALYRKYRPKNFDEVVGQKYVIQTLKNEILNDRINHAYMFFGPRGIGKTTIAKIFARAVNCENSTDGNPCEKCSKCIASKEKECVDIIEIDAASNNGVDEIREIRNKVSLVPAELRYKVYIIDEVHMLTQGAFNALLKTLEEPPKHVIFVLATTDPQKVSETIVSRCQCFSFKRISNEENTDQLEKIAKLENIEIDRNVLKEISIYSDGGLRDSLGMLDKLSSYKSGKITIEDFYEMNDMISVNSLEELYTNLMENNISKTIQQIENYNSCGKNIIEIMNQFLYYLKNKVVDYYLNNKDIANLDKTEKLLQLINEKMFDIKKTSKPYLYVEIIFLQFSNSDKIISREIISSTKTVEKTKNDNEEKEQIHKIVEKQPEDELPSTSVISEILNDDKNELVEENTSINNNENNSSNEQIKNQEEYLKKLHEVMLIRVNNTFAEASKVEKSKDSEIIEKLNDLIFDSKKGFLASEILNGTLCASSAHNLILSYDYESVVEQNILRIDELTKLFNEIANTNKKIAIITTEEWNREKNNYIQFTKQGNKYTIKEEPNISLDSKNEDSDNTSKSAAVELFGDIVEIDN